MSLVSTHISGGVATVTLDDPARRNALTAPMVAEIVDTFDTIEADPAVAVVVVTGAPPAFCAGADLGDLGSTGTGDEARAEGLRAIYDGFLRVSRCPLPTLAAVNGPAVGVGTNLALACDVRLAARSARFDTRFLALGIHPGGGHTWMLRRATGSQTAAAAVLFGEVLDAAEAERTGLVWRTVEDGELLHTAQRLGAQAAAAPRDLLMRTKATLAEMATVATHQEAVDRELEPQLWSVRQPAFAERLVALQRRIRSRGADRMR